MALVRSSSSRNKNCDCGMPMARLTSWTRENAGRKFKACKFYDPTTERRGCKCFEWVDEDDGTNWQRDVINQLLLDKKLQRGEINSLQREVEHLTWQRRCLLNENDELKIKCKATNAERKVNVGSVVVATVICCVAVFVGMKLL